MNEVLPEVNDTLPYFGIGGDYLTNATVQVVTKMTKGEDLTKLQLIKALKVVKR